jgi:DNA-binding transcriptional ArsR family regulator
MSQQGRKGREDPHIADGVPEDPERLLIVAEISEAPKSAAQLAEATGLPAVRVRRHLREMREEGLIESVVRKSKRGTVEHFNLLVGGLWEDEDDLAELSPAERRRLNGNILRIILTEATRAMVTHPTDRGLGRLDGAIVRIPLFTDEAGWAELAKLHREFYERVLETRERIRKRLEKKGEDGFKATSVLLLFESETTS